MEEDGGEVSLAEAAGRVEDGEPIGPTAADEDAIGAGEEIPQLPPELKARSTAPAGGKLPSLDSLLSRLPAPTRNAIDEHLRARFVRVRRLNPGELR